MILLSYILHLTAVYTGNHSSTRSIVELWLMTAGVTVMCYLVGTSGTDVSEGARPSLHSTVFPKLPKIIDIKITH